MKQYFAKIEAAEKPAQPRANMSVNTEAATRIIKAGLVRHPLPSLSPQACGTGLTCLPPYSRMTRLLRTSWQSRRLRREQRPSSSLWAREVRRASRVAARVLQLLLQVGRERASGGNRTARNEPLLGGDVKRKSRESSGENHCSGNRRPRHTARMPWTWTVYRAPWWISDPTSLLRRYPV